MKDVLIFMALILFVVLLNAEPKTIGEWVASVQRGYIEGIKAND